MFFCCFLATSIKAFFFKASKHNISINLNIHILIGKKQYIL